MAVTRPPITTGRRRLRAPWTTASTGEWPWPRKDSRKVTSTTPLRTATPARATKPIAAEMDYGMARSQSAKTPPETARGMPLKTSSATLKIGRITGLSCGPLYEKLGPADIG